MKASVAFTKQSIFGVNAVLWKTPSVPYVLSYVALRYTTNLTGDHNAGPAFSTISMALEINDSIEGSHSLILGPSGSFNGSYIISGRRSLFTTVIDPGFVLGSYNVSAGSQEGAVGGAFSGENNPTFHAYDSRWYDQDLWITFISQPTSWALSGTVELTVCGFLLS